MENQEEEILEINEDDIEEIICPQENEENSGLHEGVEDLDMDDEIDGDGHQRDDATLVFKEHKGSVFSIHVSSLDPTLAVSGGEDDLAYLWNTKDSSKKETKLDGHKDSVIATQFSHDGKYILTADMSGTIMIWKTTNANNVCKLECGDVEWASWHPLSHVIIAGTNDGDAYMWKVPSGECKIFSGHGSKATSGTILPQGKRLYVGYEDGSLKLWELKTATHVFHHSGEMGHSDSVTSTSSSKSGVLLASGSEDGSVKVYNSNNCKQVAAFNVNVKEGDDSTESSPGVECIGFSTDQQFICAGSLNGMFHIWDLSSQRLRHTCKHPDGVSRMLFTDVAPHIVVTACLDGCVRAWSLRSGELLQELHGHEDSILDISITADASLLLTSSDDGTARVFSVSDLTRDS